MLIAKSAIRGSFWLTVERFIRFPVGFFVGIVLARKLSPDEFGTVALSLSVLGFMQIVLGWGFGEAIIKETDEKEKLSNNLLTIALFFSIFVLILAIIFLFLLKNIYEERTLILIVIFAVSDILRCIGYIPEAILKKELMLFDIAKISIVSGMLSSIIALCLVLFGAGIWSLVFQYCLQGSISSILYFYKCPQKICFSFNIEIIRKFFQFGRNIFLSQIMEVFLVKSDRIILGTHSGTKELGFYNRAINLSEFFINLVVPGIFITSLPTFSAVKEELNKLFEAYRIIVLVEILLIFPLFIFLYFSIESIVIFIYGSKWLPSVPIFYILIAHGTLRPLFGINVQLFYALGHPEKVVLVRVYELVIFIPCLIIGVNYYGSKGAAFAMAMMISIGLAIISKDAAVLFGLKRVISMYIKPIFSGLITVMASSIINEYLKILPIILYLMCIASIVYLLFFSILFFLDQESATRTLKFIKKNI